MTTIYTNNTNIRLHDNLFQPIIDEYLIILQHFHFGLVIK